MNCLYSIFHSSLDKLQKEEDPDSGVNRIQRACANVSTLNNIRGLPSGEPWRGDTQLAERDTMTAPANSLHPCKV